MQVLIVEETDELAVECDLIKLVAFRPKMRALCFEDNTIFEQAKKTLTHKEIKFELL